MKFNILFLFTFFACNHLFSQTIEEKVDSLLQLMTIEEKVGQMTQVERGALVNINDIATYGIGSLLSGGGSAPTPNIVSAWSNMYDSFQSVALSSNLGIPLIYGIDAVHGHNNVDGAVIFPHNIGMGCTWNPALIQAANEIVAKEVSATGIDWTFAPCIAVARNERWGRTYEGFGETAEIQQIMAEASVIGLQGNDLSSNATVLACAKHFVGDGGTESGIDQGDAILSEEALRAIHMPGYINAIEAGVGTVMASYNSWNGVKLHGDEYLLTDVLKDELGFEGFVISDWKGVDQVDEDYRTAIKRAINAGIDMVMVPDIYEVYIGHLLSLVADGEVSEARINDAVSRILKQKFLLGLFEEPYSNDEFVANFGSAEHRAVAKQVVRESMVLLNAKNDVLPLAKNNQTILVAGSLADDLGAQCGGWTISWQGSNGNITIGSTILDGIQSVAETSEIIYTPTGNFSGQADVAVVVIGEKTPYSEGAGDRTNLNLESDDISMLKNLKAAGIPIVAILVSGRPMIFGELLAYTDAIIPVWYPGTEGDGIAEVLFGDYAPTGLLTHSWAKNMAQVPINVEDENYDPLFAYKHGLLDFPSSSSAENLLPYAATSDEFGNSITLALSDNITAMNADISDFKVFVNGEESPNLVSAINIADFDNSILDLSLNTALQNNDDVSISYDGNNIFSSDLILENFDNYFVYNATVFNMAANEIPGRVEAENYFDMFGIANENCEDVGGGENIGFFDAGDWVKYSIDVLESGMYSLTCRMAGYANGTVRFDFNDGVQAFVNYTSTNGWQTWQNFSTNVYLEEGLHVMELNAFTDAINFNYFDFEMVNTSNTALAKIKDIDVFPNPIKDNFTVEFSTDYHQNVSIKLIDISGKFVKQLYNGNASNGENVFSFNIENKMPTGTYFVEIKDEKKRYFKKVILE